MQTYNNNKNKKNCADYTLVKCNNNNKTLKANREYNRLKSYPALCKHSTTTTIKTTAQIMHKSDNNDNNNNEDTVLVKCNILQLMHDCSCFFMCF